MTVGRDGRTNVAALLYERSRQQSAVPQKLMVKPPMTTIVEHVGVRTGRRDSSKPPAGAAAAIVSSRRRSTGAVTARSHGDAALASRASVGIAGTHAPRVPDAPPPSSTSGRQFRRPASPAVVFEAAAAPKGAPAPPHLGLRPSSSWRDSETPDVGETLEVCRAPDLAAVSLYAAARATLGLEESPQSADEMRYAQNSLADTDIVVNKNKFRYPVAPAVRREDWCTARPAAASRCAEATETADSAAAIAYSAFHEIASPPRPELTHGNPCTEDGASASSSSSCRERVVRSQSQRSAPCTKVPQLGWSSGGRSRSRGACEPDLFAEKWLRLCRIAILELGRLPPAHRLVRAVEHVDPKELEEDDQHKTDACRTSNDEAELQSEQNVQEDGQQAVSGTDQEDTRRQRGDDNDDAQDAEEHVFENTHFEQCANLAGKGHALICLGDMMNESISWIEVDSDEDCHTPKAVNPQEAMEEVIAEQEEPSIPSALKALYRQQNAPGIVQGMKKCLSF